MRWMEGGGGCGFLSEQSEKAERRAEYRDCGRYSLCGS